MAGSIFLPGETKVRPGIYVRTTNIGEPLPAGATQGVVAALFRASWGPLGQPVLLESLQAVTETYGTGGTVDVATEALRGGVRRVLGYRLGSGGSVASVTLQDTSATDVVRIEARYLGVRGNSLRVTVRDSLTDSTKRELVVYEGTAVRDTILFAKGTGEPQALVDAVAAKGSLWVTATKLADGDGILAAVTQQPLTGGADPTVTGEDYSSALAAIEALTWHVLAVDSEDPTIHATIQAYIDRVRAEGKRVMAVLGEPTSVALSARLANAAAFNDPAVVYCANGFKGSDGVTREGYRAAARVAGMIAGAPITASLTHAVVTGATEVVGALTNAEVEQAIQSGALVFTVNSAGQVQVEYGINTLVTPGPDQDAGWRKIRRVRTRDALIDRIVAAWDALVGKVNNSPDGRATLVAAANGVIQQMVREGALLDGGCEEDPDNPPQGDSAWFRVWADDLDGAEKVYSTFGFRIAPPAQG